MNLFDLSSRIRAARLQKGYTLERVAELSGLGKGLLSKVENFRVTPSLPTLARICDALGLRMADLFDGLDTKPKFTIIRKGERMAVSRDSDQSNIHYESLAHGRTDRKMDPFELTIPAGGGRTEPMPHEGEEFLMVLSGSIAFEYEGTIYTMKEGDAAYFDAETAHRAFNPAKKEARILWARAG